MLILGAPSGAGKSTVAQRLFEVEPALSLSVSHTTRPPRRGEVDGVAYHFTSDATFDRMVAEGAFAEWAHVHAHRYGTSRAEIERLWAEGREILFDIDVQGASQLVRAYPSAVTVFMLPPSPAELERRLRGRGSEAEELVRLRLANARKEVAASAMYEFLVLNDDLGRAVADFRAILRAARCRIAVHRGRIREFEELGESEEPEEP